MLFGYLVSIVATQVPYASWMSYEYSATQVPYASWMSYEYSGLPGSLCFMDVI